MFAAAHFKITDSISSRGKNIVPLFTSRCSVVKLPNLAALTAGQEGTMFQQQCCVQTDHCEKSGGILGRITQREEEETAI